MTYLDWTFGLLLVYLDYLSALPISFTDDYATFLELKKENHEVAYLVLNSFCLHMSFKKNPVII